MNGNDRNNADVDIAVVNPTDRLRWGPILGGVFAAITAAAVLSTLGAAVGASAYDRTDDARTFAIGAGIWGVITMIVAYALGGWLAARSAAFRGKNTGLLNGAMVAAVGIPLMLFLLGSAMRGGAAAANDLSNAQARSNEGGGSGTFDGAVQASGRITPGDAAGGGGASGAGERAAAGEDAARDASRAAWGTLVALVLAIASAAAGGYLGGRDRDRVADRAGGPATA